MDKILLQKFLTDRATKEEIRSILKFSESASERQLIELLVERGWLESGEASELERQQQLWHLIEEQISDNHKKGRAKYVTFDLNYILKVAASILIVISTFIYLGTSYRPIKEKFTENTVEETIWITKSTRFGEKRYLELPDRSRVELNSGSILKYPAQFGKERQVYLLEGEAYFSVSSNVEKPFVVESRQVFTRVLGTRFNINLRDSDVKVALAEGSVELTGPDHSAKTLKPGELARIDEKNIEVLPFKEMEVMGWRQGELIIKKRPLKEVFRTLELYYGVNMEIDAKLDLNQTISGTFPNQSLENILQGLSYSLNFNFKLLNKTVKIFNNV